MKKTMACVLAIICLANCTMAFAAEPTSILQSFLSSFYTNKTESYYVFSNDGKDITALFLHQTMDLYLQNDWDGIRAKYFELNVKGIDRVREVFQDTTKGVNSSLAKTVESEHYELQAATNDANHIIEIATVMTGTFYYDPNTYIVTTASTPTLDYIAISYVSSEHVYTTPALSSSKSGINATFSCSLRVTDYVKYNGVTYITYTFPTYRHSFRVNANSNDYIIV